jgi:phosphatidylethanolamine-binding protein (PEBP) family uncharacterized protein
MIGRLLRNVRAGDRHLLWNDPSVRHAPDSIRLTSPAFATGASMPAKYVGRIFGPSLSPPLVWSNIPPETAELLLVLEDPDAPLPRPSLHFVERGIAPTLPGFPEGTLAAYKGPMPPPGHGPHRYVFQLLALRTSIPTRGNLRQALQGKVLARGRLDGIYER